MLNWLAGVSLALAAPALSQTVSAVQPIVDRGETLVLVEATGATEVVPELARFDIGVETVGDSAAAALDENNRVMGEVIAAMRQFGIKPENIRTTDFSVNPQYPNNRRSGDRSEIIGYRARNEVSVETTDLDTAGGLIATAFASGANSVGGPRFDVGEPAADAAIARAEQLALERARAQAENMAEALGLRVSRILRISDRELDFDRDYRSGGGLIVVTGSRIAPTPIERGTIPVSVQVFAEFALVPE